MRKLFIIILLIVFYVLAYFLIIENYNLLYPYYVVKDLILSPVSALVDDKIITYSNSYYEEIISSLKEDIKELKNLQNISNVLTDFDYINATIIERNRDYWFNTFTINKGKIDGIAVDMAVVDQNGLVGRISRVRRNTSDVKLITTNDVTSKISVVIRNDKDVYGIITGYDSNENLLKVNIVGKDKVEKDSYVETTGMGGIFPKGIIVGKVFDTRIDKDEVSIIVRVVPISNIKGEHYVSVLKRNEMDN